MRTYIHFHNFTEKSVPLKVYLPAFPYISIHSQPFCTPAARLSVPAFQIFCVDFFDTSPQVSCCTGSFWTRTVMIYCYHCIILQTITFFHNSIYLKNSPVRKICVEKGKNLTWYDIFLTAIELTPGGSSTVHIYTQTIHRTTQKQYIGQHKNKLEQCGPCPVLASYTLAFALQLRKKDDKCGKLLGHKRKDISFKRNGTVITVTKQTVLKLP
jgi:hypothetical protein